MCPCADTGCNLKDLTGAIDERNVWRVSVGSVMSTRLHRRSLFRSSTELLPLCPTCPVRLTCLICEIGGRCSNNCHFINSSDFSVG